MENYTKESIMALVQQQQIQSIRLQFTDIFGQLKNVAITPSQLEKALDGRVSLDGSSIRGFVRIHESDQYLRPDLSSFTVYPWQQGGIKTARLICDVYNPDGTPFVGDPRYILKRTLARAEEMGYRFNCGPELEFFLFNTDERGRPTNEVGDDASYFDLGPIDHGEETRGAICVALEEMGFEVEASHHESGRGQHEIDFRYADALTAADNIMTAKLAIKTIAMQRGLHATFMPKPLHGVPGSGMHVNMSLCTADGKNAFTDPDDERGLSKTCYSFIAGLLEHIKGITCVANPLVNSYKRLVPGYEAPCYLAWSAHNRSALVRIPVARGEACRVELRSPDTACNPYLTFALCLAAGLDGIERGLTPPEEITENIYEMDDRSRRQHGIENLPGSLFEACSEMAADELVCRTLGHHTTGIYLDGKRREWDEFRTFVTDWETARYLAKY